MTTTPAWLHAYATTTGNDPALTGTPAIPRWCRTCGLLTLAGYDSPLIATLAITDPWLLDWRQEAAAVILARPTWRLWGWPGNYELTNRHWPGLTPIGRHPPADPTATAGVHVLATHACGHPPLSTTPLPVRPPRTITDDLEPPF